MIRAEDWKKARMAKQIAAPKETVELRFDPAAFFQTVGQGRSISTYRKNEIIFSQGDAADAVFYIKEGKVKIAIVSKQGKEAVVALLGIDEFFGEGCLIGQPKLPKVRQWLARHTRWTFDFPRPQHPDPTRSKASPPSSRASASTRRFSICH
jgi:CRP-like cAMP-binding protein